MLDWRENLSLLHLQLAFEQVVLNILYLNDEFGYENE